MKELIHHTGNYSIIRSDYVQICGGDACTAQVLASFEYWTLCRSQWGHDAWIYTSINDIVDSLCGTFKRNKVIESLKVLKDKGFLESKSSLNREIKHFSISSIRSLFRLLLTNISLRGYWYEA